MLLTVAGMRTLAQSISNVDERPCRSVGPLGDLGQRKRGDQSMGELILLSLRARRAAAGFAVMLIVAVVAHPAFGSQPRGSATVQGLYDVLVSTMKHGHTLGEGGRFVQLEPVIRRTF